MQQPVLILGVGVRRAVLTNDHGVFAVEDLPTGRYTVISGHLSAFADVAAGSAAVVDLMVRGPPETMTSPRRLTDRERNVPAGLSLEISLPRHIFMEGEPILLSGRFVNDGVSAVVLLRLVDGSDSGRRAPRYHLQLLDHDRRIVTPRLFGAMCGTFNPLYAGDVFELAPGETGDPFAATDHWRSGSMLVTPWLRPGKYSVTITYENVVGGPVAVQPCPDVRDVDDASHPPPPLAPPTRVLGLGSNELTFEVTDSASRAGLRLEPTAPDRRLQLTRVSGRVLDSRGRPRPRIAVGGRFETAVTDDLGRYSLVLLQGRYRLTSGDGQSIEVTVGDRDLTVDVNGDRRRRH